MADSDLAMCELAAAVMSGKVDAVSGLLSAAPELATARFKAGATRGSANEYFLEEIERYIYAGDTALHIAAAAYQTEIVRVLIGAGADVMRVIGAARKHCMPQRLAVRARFYGIRLRRRRPLFA